MTARYKWCIIYLRKRKKEVIILFDERKFKAYMVLKGVTAAKVAQSLQINTATLYRKIQRNGDFSRSEIQKLCDFLEIDDPDSVFFAKDLA